MKTIKKRLGDKKVKRTCQSSSTQLIEAGVDVDFPVVYRSMAGIDSIAHGCGGAIGKDYNQKGRCMHLDLKSTDYPRGG